MLVMTKQIAMEIVSCTKYVTEDRLLKLSVSLLVL